MCAMGTTFCRRREVMSNAVVEQPMMHRQVCNHVRYEVMGSVFYFTIDPRVMKRDFLTDPTYMSDDQFDAWLVVFYLQKKQKVENGVLKQVLPDALIKTIAQYM